MARPKKKIFSLVNPPLRAPTSISTSQSTAPPPPPPPPPPAATSASGSDTSPTLSTHSPEIWSPPPPSAETAATSNPVLILYYRRLTAQTEALYSLLQTSLAEIKEKQEGLAKLLGQGEKHVKVLEGKVGEVVGRVGEEVDRTLIQLRSILSTTNSVLLAMDSKLIERESGNGSLLRRVDRIENTLETAVAGVQRVERVLIRMQQREEGLFSHMTQLAQREMAIGPCRGCGSGEGSGFTSIDHEKREAGLEQKGQKRNRDQSTEIPCSWNLENAMEVEGEGQGEEEDRPEPEPELEPMPKPVPKRRMLISEREMLEWELDEIGWAKAAQVPQVGHAYIEGPGGFRNGYEG